MFNDNNVINLANVRVLYVEDDSETREELQSVLENFVGELYTAKNGKEGLALFSEHLPDIVVTDIQMPEMNGLAMAADIRAINPGQAIVILSAYNDLEYLFRALELEIQNYLTKPTSVERLLKKLSDITVQCNLAKVAERDRKLLDQYKLLVDEKATVVKVDRKGHIAYVNQHFCKLSGYSEAELLGQHYLFSFAKSGQEAVLNDLKSSVLSKKKWQGILKQTTKAGEMYVVDVSVVAIVNAQDGIEEFVALMVDMTEAYKKFERLAITLKQDLHQQGHYLKEYERAMDVGTSLCLLDTQGIIVGANQNFCAALDYSPTELAGQRLSYLSQECSDFEETVVKQIKHQGNCSMVINMIGKQGRQITFSVKFVGIHDEQRNIHSIMCLSQDITKSKALNEEIIETQKELIYILGEIVENHSDETDQHIKRVSQISELLARKYGLGNEHALMIKVASSLHDIGKVNLPDDLLNKPGKLSNAEYEIVKNHAESGFKLLNRSEKPLIKMASTIAHQHHERYDGKGYPNGLSGDQIAIEARIVSIADVFDALSSKRVYKEPWTIGAILNYFYSNRSLQFDPVLVDLFIKHIDEVLEIRNQFSDVQ
jgi:PAS domain S-box-containing protein